MCVCVRCSFVRSQWYVNVVRGAWCMAFLLPPRADFSSLFFICAIHVARFTFAFFACVERSCLHHHFIVVFIFVLVPFWVVPLMVHTRTWCIVSVTQKENSWERHNIYSIVDYKQWNETKIGSRRRKKNTNRKRKNNDTQRRSHPVRQFGRASLGRRSKWKLLLPQLFIDEHINSIRRWILFELMRTTSPPPTTMRKLYLFILMLGFVCCHIARFFALYRLPHIFYRLSSCSNG